MERGQRRTESGDGPGWRQDGGEEALGGGGPELWLLMRASLAGPGVPGAPGRSVASGFAGPVVAVGAFPRDRPRRTDNDLLPVAPGGGRFPVLRIARSTQP